MFATCDFDLLFTYYLCGWEGTAHDAKVFRDALQKGFPNIEGKFWLGDAGFAFTWYCLVPYRGVRYHLKEWARARQRPQNKEELFNLRHASLRNAIERIFGVVKKRFSILRSMDEHNYPFEFQIILVRCCFIIHNFLRMNKIEDDKFDDWNYMEVDANDPNEEASVIYRAPPAEQNNLNTWRDGIAQQMYNDYLEILATREQGNNHTTVDEFDDNTDFDN